MITIHKTFPAESYTVDLTYKQWGFPAGETGIRLDTSNLRFLHCRAPITLIARLKHSVDFIELIMVVDALRRWDRDRAGAISLILPYLPYSRQDRACTEGEAFSLKAFAQVINGLGFTSVTTFDVHSDVAAGVFDRFIAIDQKTIIGRFQAFNGYLTTGPRQWVFVAPDAGANKRVSSLAALYGCDRFVRADKLRNLATGEIIETAVYGDVTGLECVAVDDLCDGGRTFIELAKALKAHGAAKVILYVTHGVMSKGLKPLIESGIDHVYTTSSFAGVSHLDAHPKLSVLDLEEAFAL